MKIIKDSDVAEWADKYNFVDENNVVVGYSSSQGCCENAAYFFADIEPTEADSRDEADPAPSLLEPYRFDPDYFKELPDTARNLDSGGCVAFRLLAPDKPPLYLVLFNSHNGYYSHGFTVKVNGQQTREGSL